MGEGRTLPGLIFLIQAGPMLLLASVVVMAVAVALRARLAVLAALVAGGLLYWGIYVQVSVGVTYVAIAFGLATWLAVIAWTKLRPRPRPEV